MVERAAAAGRRVKAVGAGHSFTDIACTDGHLVDLRDYGRLLSFDPATCRATVQAGIRLTELNRLLADSYEVLARSYLGVGSRDRAEDTFRRGRQLAEALANDNPHDKDDRQRLETISRELALVGPARTPR